VARALVVDPKFTRAQIHPGPISSVTCCFAAVTNGPSTGTTGVKVKQIADQLHLSVTTVETYRRRIRQKLGLSDTTALAHYATQPVLKNG
jgi:hypothetical protein